MSARGTLGNPRVRSLVTRSCATSAESRLAWISTSSTSFSAIMTTPSRKARPGLPALRKTERDELRAAGFFAPDGDDDVLLALEHVAHSARRSFRPATRFPTAW